MNGPCNAEKTRRAGLVWTRRSLNIAAAAMLLAVTHAAFAFDHAHAAWDALLKRHVVVSNEGNASRVNYAGFAREQKELNVYLGELSSVTEGEYGKWGPERQLAFLINAYNAFTVKLVLTRYPDLASIKDLGSFLRSPWKKAFFTLLGAERSLDDVEHGLIRAPGIFNEPRIHFAVNCAAIGCPMLRAEAYRGDRLDAQLEDGARRFLGDRSRNRFDPATGSLALSRIFDWYQGDFQKGDRGVNSVAQFIGRHAELLADDAAARAAVRQGQVKIRYLDYDWSLNDLKR